MVRTASTMLPLGTSAPDFTLADVSGKPVKLSDFRGRYVVLEWVNPECPYVEKHYGSANMQGLQKEFTSKQVVWLSINSTREGHYEYYPPQKMAGWMKQVGGAPSATLLDPHYSSLLPRLSARAPSRLKRRTRRRLRRPSRHGSRSLTTNAMRRVGAPLPACSRTRSRRKSGRRLSRRPVRRLAS